MTGPGTYFSTLQLAFEAETAAHRGPFQYDYCIAGHRIRLNFANQVLVPHFTPALSHLCGSFDDSAQLEINIGDDAGSVLPIPAPPWTWENYTSRGKIGGLDTARFLVWFHVASGILSMLDLEHGRAVMWVRDLSRLPMYVTAAPLRLILHGWLSRYGLQFAHAAAVGNAKGGVLLAGEGGSGKSTTSLACLDAGMSFVSDDYCVIASEPKPWVHSVYCSAKVSRDILPHLPGLASAVQQRNDPPGEKALLLLNESFTTQTVPGFPLRALLAPKIYDQPTSTLVPVRALALIQALAPSTLHQIAGADPTAWRMITSLARQLPCYQLRLGRDLASTAAVISHLLEDQV